MKTYLHLLVAVLVLCACSGCVWHHENGCGSTTLSIGGGVPDGGYAVGVPVYGWGWNEYSRRWERYQIHFTAHEYGFNHLDGGHGERHDGSFNFQGHGGGFDNQLQTDGGHLFQHGGGGGEQHGGGWGQRAGHKGGH